ncbi:hypothetical protein [Streptomyces naphthomycinicus]|uniref:hypothetical protein n=1 Tax=Streptomyces naphthomycinicus TaxID=2872625 RepID=UPI001CEC7EC2|nr:hypothetical protein [Streptomyces sp. TML10]
MTNIKFFDVFAQFLEQTEEPIVLRVDGEKVFADRVESNETASINLKVPIATTLTIQLGTEDPFQPFLYQKLDPGGNFLIEELEAFEIAVNQDSPNSQDAFFRSKIPHHHGKFTLSYRLPG